MQILGAIRVHYGQLENSEYLDTSRLGIYPPLFTSPTGDSCVILQMGTQSPYCPFLILSRHVTVSFSQPAKYSGFVIKQFTRVCSWQPNRRDYDLLSIWQNDRRLFRTSGLEIGKKTKSIICG